MNQIIIAPPSVPDGTFIYSALQMEFIDGEATVDDLNATEQAYLAGFGCTVNTKESAPHDEDDPADG